jgi:hypothetical protein
MVKDARQPCGWRRLPDERALDFFNSLETRRCAFSGWWGAFLAALLLQDGERNLCRVQELRAVSAVEDF